MDSMGKDLYSDDAKLQRNASLLSMGGGCSAAGGRDDTASMNASVGSAVCGRGSGAHHGAGKGRGKLSCLPRWARVSIVVCAVVMVGLALGLGLGLGLRRRDSGLLAYKAELGKYREILENVTTYPKVPMRMMDDEADFPYDKYFYGQKFNTGWYTPVSSFSAVVAWHTMPTDLPPRSYDGETRRKHREAVLYAYYERQKVEQLYAEGKEPVLSICQYGATKSASSWDVFNNLSSVVGFIGTILSLAQMIYDLITGDSDEEAPIVPKDERTSPCAKATSAWGLYPRQWYWMPQAMTKYYNIVVGMDSVSVSCTKRRVNEVNDNVTTLGCFISIKCACPSGLLHEMHQMYNVTMAYKEYHTCLVGGFVITEFVFNHHDGEQFMYADKHYLPTFILGVGTSKDDARGLGDCDQNTKYEWFDEATKEANAKR